MTGERRDDVGQALRALAHPVTVGSLVVMALNDHMLKQAWPGFVTGKLSDVAGLVVAPLVLAVVLAAARVPRAVVVSVALTGAVFAWVKTTALGSDVASAAWSAVAGTSYLRADPTDLLALPALFVALRVHRLAGRPRPPFRTRAMSAVGSVVLPFAVLATAATSPCDDGAYARDVVVLQGLWPKPDGRLHHDRRLVYFRGWYELRVLGDRVAIRRLSTSERDRVDEDAAAEVDRTFAACDPAQSQRCWTSVDPEGSPEADPTTVERVLVWASTDGGMSWDAEVVLDAADVARVRGSAGEVCGKPLRLAPGPLAVLATDEGPAVALTMESAGVAVRSSDGDWAWIPAAKFEAVRKGALREEQATPTDPEPREPVLPSEVLSPVTPVLPAEGDDTAAPTPTRPSPSPAETCASPVLVTVTPDPRNGEPFADRRCPAPPPSPDAPGS